jgi:hypothetical protein
MLWQLPFAMRIIEARKRSPRFWRVLDLFFVNAYA